MTLLNEGNVEEENSIKEGHTLAWHAEQWWIEKGNKVPSRDTKEWQNMYEEWIEFAFKDFAK